VREIKFWRAFQEGLSEEMRRDPTILYFGEDAGGKVGGPFALAKGLQDEFGGKRVYDTPDSEAGCVGLAIGLDSFVAILQVHVLVTEMYRLYASKEHKEKFLPILASGDKLGGFALTEPNAGSDASAIVTRADLRDGR